MRRVVTMSVLVVVGACGAPSIDTALDTDGVTLPDRAPDTADGGTPTNPRDSAPPPPDTVTLTVTLTGSGAGTISATPNNLTCSGTTCKGTFPKGTAVSLAATPSVGSVFGGWSAPCMGTAACATTLSADVTTGAAFQSITGTWSGTYTNNRVVQGCTFNNAGNVTSTIKATGGAFSSAETMTGLQLKTLPGCQLVATVNGTGPDEPIAVANDTITGTWNIAVQGANGTLAFPFTAKVAGKTMTGTWTCATCTGGFTLTTP